MDIYTESGIAELMKKLDGIVLHNVSTTTAVPEKELPTPEVVLVNAPETLEDAIQRIIKAEMCLEDLVRAAEIVGITKQLEILDTFTRAADEYLKTKIEMIQPSAENFKVTIITDEKEK